MMERVHRFLHRMGFSIASLLMALIVMAVFLGVPILGITVSFFGAWLIAAPHFWLTMILWFVLVICGSIYVYNPYIKPLTLKLIDTFMKWSSETKFEMWK